MSNPRNYSKLTLKQLFAKSGNQCAFPGCDQQLVNDENAQSSNICHIEAAFPGGERYNPSMTDAMRAHYDNLILLCPNHHVITNDTKTYTVDVLKKMKVDHEQYVVNSVRPIKRLSLLPGIIKEICKLNLHTTTTTHPIKPFNIEDKIAYNNVIRNNAIIVDHSHYVGRLQSIYAEFERSGSDRYDRCLRTVSTIYSEQKGKILGNDLGHANIQKHADDLIDAVKDDLHKRIEPNLNLELDYEDVEFAIYIILVDAFMRCKILQEPQ